MVRARTCLPAAHPCHCPGESIPPFAQGIVSNCPLPSFHPACPAPSGFALSRAGIGVSFYPQWAEWGSTPPYSQYGLWPCTHCSEGVKSLRDAIILILSTGLWWVERRAGAPAMLRDGLACRKKSCLFASLAAAVQVTVGHARSCLLQASRASALEALKPLPPPPPIAAAWAPLSP